MFYAAKNWKEGLPPLMVFTLQIFTLSLILYNLLETNGSPLDLQYNIPVDVPPEVTMAQIIACIISVYTAADFVDALFFVRRPIILPNCQDERRDIKDLSLKWEFSNLMRMSEGAFAIAVSFVFIVQSTTVIDLFLNFAGVAFVSELDDAHFKLAERGLLGKRAKKLADRLSTFKVHTDEKKVRGIVRNCLFVTIITGMLCGLAVIAYRQDYPKYACKSVTLTVGERKYPSYRSFSGTYTLDGPVKIAKRAVYIQDQGEGAFIAYCERSERWTVTRQALLLVDDDVPSFNDGSFPRDPCSTHVMQSEKTRTYDISELSELQYFSGEAADGDIKCNECSTSEERSSETCSYQGKCVETELSLKFPELKKKTCQCNPGHFGISCQFQGPCTELIFQEDEFPGYRKKFQLMYHNNEPLMVHDRPAYIQRNFSIDGTLGFAFVIYDGGRWKVVESDNGKEVVNDDNFEVEKYLAEEFHALYVLEGYSQYKSSELSYAGMPDVPFRAQFTSEESDWSFGRLGEKEFNLLCADCLNGESGVTNCFGEDGLEDTKLCQLVNQPEETVYRCNCPPGFIGPLCQTRPVEGNVQLHLEHGAPNACSSCGENNMWNVWDLTGNGDNTCIPFPREPLIFEGSDGNTFTRQVGLHLSSTHFSVFVSDYNFTFPKGDNSFASENICSAEYGKKIRSIERNDEPKDQIHIDFAVLLNNSIDFFGEVVDSGDIDCFTKEGVNENECDGSKDGTLARVYHKDGRSDLTRAWIQLDLKVTK
jgi:hypothetical protein